MARSDVSPPPARCASLVVVAAGSATRMGTQAVRKPLLELGGRALVVFTAQRLAAAPSVAELVVVTHPDDGERIGELLGEARLPVPARTVPGGASRTESVRAGVAACATHTLAIGVHDGARPFVAVEAIERCVAAALEHGGALLATPVTDTLHAARPEQPDRSERTVDRTHLWAAQTPQCFRAGEFRALLEALPDSADATDDAGLWRATGRHVQLVPSSPDNFKITRPDDLSRARALLAALPESP